MFNIHIGPSTRPSLTDTLSHFLQQLQKRLESELLNTLRHSAPCGGNKVCFSEDAVSDLFALTTNNNHLQHSSGYTCVDTHTHIALSPRSLFSGSSH